MSLIKFLICAAFIKATTCAETMLFLYEDFELPEEDRNAEILFMKNIPCKLLFFYFIHSFNFSD